jgi:hypothetical protein
MKVIGHQRVLLYASQQQASASMLQPFLHLRFKQSTVRQYDNEEQLVHRPFTVSEEDTSQNGIGWEREVSFCSFELYRLPLLLP